MHVAHDGRDPRNTTAKTNCERTVVVKLGLRWISGAVVMGLIWAVLWASAGALLETLDPGGSLHARWVGPPIGMHTGFAGGVVFSVLIGWAARPRRFDESPLALVVACGGLVGLLLGVLPLAINAPPGESPLLVVALVIGSMILMSSVSAAGSLALARTARIVRR